MTTLGSCRYQVRVMACGTEADGVTVQRRTYLSVQSGSGHFTEAQLAAVHAGLKRTSPLVEYKYLTDDRVFALQLRDMFHAQKALQTAGFTTKDQVPYFVWRWLCEVQERVAVSERELQERLGDDIWHSLHPYQRVCVQKAVTSQRFYIADEMGTGKTFQCLATCKYFQPEWPVLIFCPSSLRYTWRAEIVRWLGVLESDVLVAKNTQHFVKHQATPHNFLVLPYSLLGNKKVTELVKARGYQVTVFDEAHYVKSMYSKRANQACLLAEKAKVKLLLSGTPFNYPSEMYQQLKILDPQLYPRFFNGSLEEDREGEYYFAKRYCRPQSSVVRGHNVWSFRGYDNHEELNALLSTLMLRRRKVDILTQLPAKNRICITLEPLPPKQAKEITELLKAEKAGVVVVAKGEPTTAPAPAPAATGRSEAKYMESFRLGSKYKIPNVLKFLKEQILEDCMTQQPQMKTLIFFHHDVMRKALEELLTDTMANRFPFFVISGATSPTKRDEYRELFQTTDRYRIGLLSITAAGVGLTLTAASTEVFTEILFGPNDHLQAEDRAHRLGQNSAVNIFYLIQPQTTDDINFGLIRKKERESSLMLDGQASALPARRVAAVDLAQPTGTLKLHDIMKFKTSDSPQGPAVHKRTFTAAEEEEDDGKVTKVPTRFAVSKRPMVQVYKLHEPT